MQRRVCHRRAVHEHRAEEHQPGQRGQLQPVQPAGAFVEQFVAILIHPFTTPRRREGGCV